MYSDTCINRSCSKAETLFRRTDTLDLICFLYAFLSHISKAETVKRALLQTDNFFSVIRLKNNLLYPDTKKNFRNSEKQRIKLNIFVNFLKKKNFLHFKTAMILSDFILQFWRNTILLSRTLYLFLQITFCHHPTCVTESDIGQRPLNHTPPLYELLPSLQWLTLSFGEVSMTCR